VTKATKENIFDTLREMLDQMLGDWEYSGQITPETFLVSDLGLESLDIVVLGEAVQKHYRPKTLSKDAPLCTVPGRDRATRTSGHSFR